MPSRPDITVVIRMRGLLLRADMRGGGEPLVKRWRRDWPELAAAVAHALADGGRSGRRVWVLDSEVWLGAVELPSGAVAGLSDQDLADPAAFESEAISGMAPIEAVTAVQRRRMADQDDQFLVAQAKRGEVVTVAKAVRGAGARLTGIGHPAGLPDALELEAGQASSSEAGGWRRVEFWNETVVLAESVAGRASLIPLGISPQSDWRKLLAPHLSRGVPVGDDQTLIEPGVRVRGGTQWRENTVVGGTARWMAAGDDEGDGDDDGVPVCDLSDDTAAEPFAAAWARRLATAQTSQGSPMPTLRPPKGPAARWPAVLVGVVALALVISAVMVQHDRATHRLTALRAELKSVEGDHQTLSERRKQVNLLRGQLENKKQAVDELERKVVQLSQQRLSKRPAHVDRQAALAELMEALSRFAVEHVVIQSIEHASPQHEITGLALTPAAASRLARNLSEQLRNHWVVSPARIEPRAAAERIVWRFSISIKPAAGMGEAQ